MNTQQKRDFLINAAYWGFIILIAYLVIQYILPITVPFILGFLVAYLIVRITRKLKVGSNRWVRVALVLLVYGTVGVLVALIAIKGFSLASSFVSWLPNLYEQKLAPAMNVLEQWVTQAVDEMDSSVQNAVNVLGDSLVSVFNNLFASVSGYAVNFVSDMVTGVPSLLLSTLAMIFSTVFVAVDYEKMRAFVKAHMRPKWIVTFKTVRAYLTDTLLVVIRSYLIIMMLTATELTVLFALFHIGNPLIKALAIAVFDIMPVLGTGGIMIPWAVISLVIGNTTLGIELFIIYAIVTVVRNYVEPKVVGAQLGLHPVITLVSMFIGLRLFGFLGLFGFPVVISFFWKRKNEKEKAESGDEMTEEDGITKAEAESAVEKE